MNQSHNAARDGGQEMTMFYIVPSEKTTSWQHTEAIKSFVSLDEALAHARSIAMDWYYGVEVLDGAGTIYLHHLRSPKQRERETK